MANKTELTSALKKQGNANSGKRIENCSKTEEIVWNITEAIEIKVWNVDWNGHYNRKNSYKFDIELPFSHNFAPFSDKKIITRIKIHINREKCIKIQ